MEIKEIESALEGILFAVGDPMELDKLSAILGVAEEDLEKILKDLSDGYRYNRRGIRLLKLENAYQLTSAPEYSEYVKQALGIRKPPTLSLAALEVLSIIAYYQPTTRAYIEQIRGVDSSGTVGLLVERGLVEPCGTLDVPGKPQLFRTTPTFLRTFGMASVEELPPLPDGESDGQLRIDDVDEIPAAGESGPRGDKNAMLPEPDGAETCVETHEEG